MASKVYKYRLTIFGEVGEWINEERFNIMYPNLLNMWGGDVSFERQEIKTFYRVANSNNEGVWYDKEGNHTGLIHTKFNFLSNHELPMPYDKDVVGWHSAVDSLDDLYNWFTKDDIENLKPFGYKVVSYIDVEFRKYKNHYLIKI